MTKKYKVFNKNITLYILSKFMFSLLVYCTVILALYLLGKVLSSLFIWHSDEAMYQLFKWVELNSTVIMSVLFLIGFFALLAFYWNKTLGYLKTVVSATENMYNEQDDLVELPQELKDVEKQMNQIKVSLRKSQRAAKEAEQRKNDLIVYLAHDLKTPLTSVIGYLTLLRDEGQISDELRQKYLSISLDKAERLEDLINEFFEITRFNLSHIYLEPSKVNLTRMLEQITFEFKPMLSEKRLKCKLKAEENMFIYFDVDKMQRVFDNLLRNAVNYSFENSTIEIYVKKEESFVRLNFINQGNTIPKQKLEHMFEQFYRLDISRSTKSGGAGLGLAITKEIVELHGGTITVKSENETVDFEILLPL